jgi:hypothetical protein
MLSCVHQCFLYWRRVLRDEQALSYLSYALGDVGCFARCTLASLLPHDAEETTLHGEANVHQWSCTNGTGHFVRVEQARQDSFVAVVVPAYVSKSPAAVDARTLLPVTTTTAMQLCEHGGSTQRRCSCVRQCHRRLSSRARRYAASTAAVESCRSEAMAIGYADTAGHVSVRSPCHTTIGSDAASTAPGAD